MRDYDFEAEYIQEEFLSGAMDAEERNDYMRQLDDERDQEARQMYGEENI